MEDYPFISYSPKRQSQEDMLAESQAFFDKMDERRSVRQFSSESFDIRILENIIATASTAPSGAHKQPWSFCVVSNPELKSRIRALAEKEEEENYHGRMSDEWIEDLKPLGTDEVKDFLEIAPYLIIVFKQVHGIGEEGEKKRNYYVNESVGIAVGFLLAAIHNAGLCSLTHTPSPMNFLEKALGRPANERAFLLIPVGYPAEHAKVPDIHRKPLNLVMGTYL
jgi:iodotyrosine deiodinase